MYHFSERRVSEGVRACQQTAARDQSIVLPRYEIHSKNVTLDTFSTVSFLSLSFWRCPISLKPLPVEKGLDSVIQTVKSPWTYRAVRGRMHSLWDVCLGAAVKDCPMACMRGGILTCKNVMDWIVSARRTSLLRAYLDRSLIVWCIVPGVILEVDFVFFYRFSSRGAT